MADDLSGLIEDAAKIGFKYVGRDGRNHAVLVTDTGLRYTTSFTTSDWRSYQNALRDMERLSGRKLPRQKTGKFRFKRPTHLDVRLSPTEARDTALIDDLLTRADSLRQSFRELVDTTSRRNVQAARQILDDFEDVRKALADHHRVIDPIF